MATSRSWAQVASKKKSADKTTPVESKKDSTPVESQLESLMITYYGPFSKRITEIFTIKDGRFVNKEGKIALAIGFINCVHCDKSMDARNLACGLHPDMIRFVCNNPPRDTFFKLGEEEEKIKVQFLDLYSKLSGIKQPHYCVFYSRDIEIVVVDSKRPFLIGVRDEGGEYIKYLDKEMVHCL